MIGFIGIVGFERMKSSVWWFFLTQERFGMFGFGRFVYSVFKRKGPSVSLF